MRSDQKQFEHKMNTVREGNITDMIQFVLDEYIEKGGTALSPEDLLTAILFQKLPNAYDAAKMAVLFVI